MMKKKVLTTVLSAVMIAGSGIGAVSAFQQNKTGAAYSYHTGAQQPDSRLSEMAAVADVIGYEPEGRIVKDNTDKRIMIYSNEQGRAQHKSIFFKNQQTVKVIDLRAGQLYDGPIY